MKTLKFLIPTFVALQVIIGCSQQEGIVEKNDYEAHEQPMAEFEEVYSLALYDGTEFEDERSFDIEDDTFKKNLVLGNKTSIEGSFVLLVFNHGEQLTYEVDNQSTFNHEFNIKPDEYKDLEITLSDLKDGFHSITYFLLHNPDEYPEDYERSMSLSDMFSLRVNLFRNTDSISSKPSVFNQSMQTEERRIHGTFIGKEEDMYEVSFDEEINKSDSISLNLIYGNGNSEPFDFYLVSLLNFEQIPIGEFQNIYDELNPDEEKSISIDLDYDLLDGNENAFQTIMITSPFENVTEDDPFLLQDPLASNRTNINKLN